MSTAVNTRKPANLKEFLENHIESVKSVAAKTLTPERMVGLVCAAASRDEKLASCTPLSILRALAQAASMGLEPFDGRNEVHLVPRWNSKAKGGEGAMEATCLPDFRGLIRLAVDTGKVRNIEARSVRKNDIFEVEMGDSPKLTHKLPGFTDRGEIVGFYAIAFYPEGGSTFEVMSLAEVEAIRDRSKDKGGFSPWKTDFEEMGRKTVVRRLSKYLPKKSVELGNALEVQAKTEAGEYFDVDVARPGDAPEIEDKSAREVDGDGKAKWIWSKEDTADFHTALDVLDALMIKANYSEKELKDKIDFYQEQKDSGLEAPHVVLRRMAAASDGIEAEAKANG